MTEIYEHVFCVKYNHYSAGYYSLYYHLRRVISFIRSYYIIYLMEIGKKDLYIMM